jgi:small subunit ribosomal protein S16
MEEKLVKLRLTRMGRKKAPFYRIIAVESSKRRDGEYIEKIGLYNPINDSEKLVVDHKIALKWLMNGAQPSDTVHSLLQKSGVMMKFDMMKRFKREKAGEKWLVIRDANGNPVRKYSDEEVEAAFQNWLKIQAVKAEKKATGEVKKLSKKAKAKLAAEAKAAAATN